MFYISRSLRRKSYHTLSFLKPVAKGAVIANEASKYLGYGSYPAVGAVLPVYGIARSSLELFGQLTAVIDGYSEGLSGAFRTLGSAQLLIYSRMASLTGSVAFVYHGLALKALSNFSACLNDYAQFEYDQRGIRDNDYEQKRTEQYTALLNSALECAGWSLLAMGNPAGAILLALHVLPELIALKNQYAPNFSSFSLFSKKSSSASTWDETEMRGARPVQQSI